MAVQNEVSPFMLSAMSKATSSLRDMSPVDGLSESIHGANARTFTIGGLIAWRLIDATTRRYGSGVQLAIRGMVHLVHEV